MPAPVAADTRWRGIFFFANARLSAGYASRTSVRSAFERATTSGRLARAGIEGLELLAEGEVVLHGIAPFARVERDEVKKHARSLDVLQKLDAEPRAFARAGNEARDVGDDEVLVFADRDDTEVRHERRERIVADLGAGARYSANERALARVGEAEQADVRHHLQLQASFEQLAVFTGLGAPRCAVPRRGEVDVAATPTTPTRDDCAGIGGGQVEEQRACGLVEDLRPRGHAHDEVFTAVAVLILAAPGLARFSLERVLVGEVEERRHARVGSEHDVAPLAAVASRRAAVWRELLAPKRHAPIAAATGHDAKLAAVDEAHAPTLSQLRPFGLSSRLRRILSPARARTTVPPRRNRPARRGARAPSKSRTGVG